MAQSDSPALFDARFRTREQVLHYRDRYRTGRRVRTNEREHLALNTLLASLPPLSGALDIPCGTGRMFQPLVKCAGRVVLADQSPVMLDVAREDLSSPAAEFLETSAEAINLPDAAVDMVFSHRLLPHIYDESLRARMFKEFARVTRRYVIVSFYPPGVRRRLRWLWRSITGRSRLADQLTSIRQVKREAAAAGLRLVGRQTLRKFPPGAFLLFERTT